MKKYPAPAESHEMQLKEAPPSGDLEFPVAPDFISRPPRIDPQVMLRRIEETMPWRNQRPGAREQRLAEKISAEFIL
ncbi:MAG: hypothetical protein ABIW93_10565 [Verrucomicrobiota bacterium]